MESIEHALKEHPLFKELDSRFVKDLTQCSSLMSFDAGQYIFHEGDPANYLYLIRQGKVALEIYAPNRGYITIQTLNEGDLLGWSWFISPYRKRFDARTVELTRVIALEGEYLRKKCEENHDLGYEVLKRVTNTLAQRLQATRIQILDIYGTGSRK